MNKLIARVVETGIIKAIEEMELLGGPDFSCNVIEDNVRQALFNERQVLFCDAQQIRDVVVEVLVRYTRLIGSHNGRLAWATVVGSSEGNWWPDGKITDEITPEDRRFLHTCRIIGMTMFLNVFQDEEGLYDAN